LARQLLRGAAFPNDQKTGREHKMTTKNASSNANQNRGGLKIRTAVKAGGLNTANHNRRGLGIHATA
jgi:hypothetical protein